MASKHPLVSEIFIDNLFLIHKLPKRWIYVLDMRKFSSNSLESKY